MVVLKDNAPSTTRAGIKPLVAFKANDARYAGFPNYIFGLHDSGGEAFMFAANKPGWTVVTVQVNPPDSTGDFSPLSDKGLGVIVRLNNGYGAVGTLPVSTLYDQFALHCASFVGNSKGARIWIIGNEPNAAYERPGNVSGTNSGEMITPEMYARCFNKCRKAIRAIPGHENDWVIPGAVAPFNIQTIYSTNPAGDWVRYFADVLFQITVQGGAADGLALHAFTHGYDPNLISSEERAGGNYSVRHWHFRAYRDFLATVIPAMRNLPVFITEAQPAEPGWINQNRSWVQAACAEINEWNSNPANQPIQALSFFRWQSIPGDPSGWGIADKPMVVSDFRAALEHDYRVRWPGVQPTPDYRVQWISVPTVPLSTMTTNEVMSGRVVVKNIGAKAWLAGSANPVRLGYRWFNQQGVEIPILPEPAHVALPQNILPGQTAIIDDIKLRAPQWQGVYTVKFDLVQEGIAWFNAFGSPTKELTVAVNAPPYAVEWDQVITVLNDSIATNANLIGTVKVKNIGSRTWLKNGPNPVRLGFHWYNGQAVDTPVTPYAGNFEMDADTPPGKTGTFNGVILRSPQWEGTYTLRWDLVQEGITWFSTQNAATRDQTITVTLPLPDFAAKWLSVFEIPNSLEPNETVKGSITVQNVGAQIWNAAGENPVRLGYHWYDAMGEGVLVAPYPGNFLLQADVPPNGTATFDEVLVRAPISQGKYTLALDLVKENVMWFSASGSRPYDVGVAIKTEALDDYAKWEETVAIPKLTLVAGDTIAGRVSLRNAGALMWNAEGEHPVRLGYHWYDASGAEVPLTAEGRVPLLSLPLDVPPREALELEEVAVQAPDTPGEYMLKWDLYREGVNWFAAGGSPTPELAITILPPPLAWGAEFISHNAPASLVVGQTTTVDLKIKNVGKNPWSLEGEHTVHAGYKWINASGQLAREVEDHRTALPYEVAPGNEVEFAALLAAPQTPGAYRLHWDLYAEASDWFAEGSNPELILPVNVTPSLTPTNLWRAEASHNPASAILALDGDLGSFWSSGIDQVPGAWFRLNLGTPRLIDGIAFRSPGQGYPFGYTLRVSPDGQSWRTLWGVAQGNTRDVVAYFAPYYVLYAQVDLLAASESEWLIGEVQVHPCLPWNATASVSNESAPNAIDNNPSTAWTTNTSQVPNTWFQLDLGRVENISGLRLIPVKDEIPLGYRVSVWNQPVGGWQKISERLNNSEPINLTFAPVSTQYINVQLLQASDKPWAIREARVMYAMTDWVGPSTG